MENSVWDLRIGQWENYDFLSFDIEIQSKCERINTKGSPSLGNIFTYVFTKSCSIRNLKKKRFLRNVVHLKLKKLCKKKY